MDLSVLVKAGAGARHIAVLLGIEIPFVFMLAKNQYLRVGQAFAEPPTNVAPLVTSLCVFGIEQSSVAKRVDWCLNASCTELLLSSV
jgi:hypothetical protein